MKFIKSLSFLFLFVFLFASTSYQGKTAYLEISKFVDGDTFWVKYPDGKEEKVRFIGINSPEARNTGRTKIEYFGKESSNFVRQLLTGKKVRLEYDVQRYDRYKRTLAYVYLDDGTFLNALLVKEGYANVATYPPNVKYSALFTELEREARKRGMDLLQKTGQYFKLGLKLI